MLNLKSNDQLGSYVVTASAVGLQSANFSLKNSAFYVAVNGSDSNNCKTPATPCATINAALGKAPSGDTIYVASGEYTDSGDAVATFDKSITLSGGWNASFTVQDGFSTINGEEIRSGILVGAGADVFIERFIMEYGRNESI